MRRALRIWVGASQYEVPVGVATVGDPHLLAIQDVAVALLFRFGLNGSDVRPSARFGYAISTHKGLLNHPTEVFLLLFIVTREDDGGLPETVGFHSSSDATAAV